MLTRRSRHRRQQRGASMIEVLVTIVILAFGLLGLASLQSKIQLALVESYQRAQAVLLLTDMKERIKANREQAATYVSADVLGTDDTQPINCSTIAVGVDRDRCMWSNALKGAAETDGSGNLGAMVGARGCIELIQKEEEIPGTSCIPGIYQITVAWQGMHPTKAPNAACGKDLYGNDDAHRRAISERVAVGLPACS